MRLSKVRQSSLTLPLSLISVLLILSGIIAGTTVVKQGTKTLSSAASNCDTNPSPSGRTQITKNAILCPDTNNYAKGIDITGSNITLTCSSGVTIDGGGNQGQNPGISIKASGVTVSNCTVKGFLDGLDAQGPINGLKIDGGDYSHNSIGSSYLADSNFLGPWLDNNAQSKNIGSGIYFNNVTNSQIVNAVTSLYNVTGVTLQNSQGITVDKGNFSNNSAWGLHLITTTGSSITNNVATNNLRKCIITDNQGKQVTVSGCESAGILLVDGSNGNTISGNDFSGGGNGFYINGCNHKQSNDNTITSNRVGSATSNGFEATFSTGNHFDKNTSTGNPYGFWLGYSDHTLVTNSNISGSTNSIDIQNSYCNAIVGNSGSGNINLYPHAAGSNACEQNATTWNPNIKPNSCSNNYGANNDPNFTFDHKNCTGDSTNAPISSCNLPLGSFPTSTPGGPSPTQTPGNPNPTQTPPPGRNPTQPPGGGGGGGGGGGNPNTILKINVYVTKNGSRRLWNSSDGKAQVYISGPTTAGGGFSEVMDVPTTSGTCRTDPKYDVGATQGYPFKCQPGTIFWAGAPPNTNGSYPGTGAGSYSVQIFSLPTCTPPNCLAPSPYPNPAVTLTTGQTSETNLEIVSSTTQFNPPTGNQTPTPNGTGNPTQSPDNTLGYTNKDYQKIIEQYSREVISPLTVSAWLTKATRVPGLQTAICYPPNCDFRQ